MNKILGIIGKAILEIADYMNEEKFLDTVDPAQAPQTAAPAPPTPPVPTTPPAPQTAAPAPPTPPVPTVPTPPTAPLAPVETDAEGLPWDARIHVASRSKVKDGTWRIKPKTDPVLVAQVKTELRGSHPAPAPKPEEPKVFSFVQLMTAIATSGITKEQIAQALTEAGLSGLEDLPGRPDLVPTVALGLGLL